MEKRVVASMTVEFDEFTKRISSGENFLPTLLRDIFTGRNPYRRFNIPAADGNTRVTFRNREILARFTALQKESQATFLKTVRSIMDEEGVNRIELSVPWTLGTPWTSRILTIERESSTNNLEIDHSH